MLYLKKKKKKGAYASESSLGNLHSFRSRKCDLYMYGCVYVRLGYTKNQKSRLTFAKQTDRYR